MQPCLRSLFLWAVSRLVLSIVRSLLNCFNKHFLSKQPCSISFIQHPLHFILSVIPNKSKIMVQFCLHINRSVHISNVTKFPKIFSKNISTIIDLKNNCVIITIKFRQLHIHTLLLWPSFPLLM